MNPMPFLHLPPLFVEIGTNSLQAAHENDQVEMALERAPDGRLTAASKEKTTAALKDFLKAKSWQPRVPAFCALNARGVSLRRLSLPAGTQEEFQQRLLLQIEAEFPLSPDELAWGWQTLGAAQSSNGVMARQDVLVAAVKKEIVADYNEILRACGTEATFTLAALARLKNCEGLTDSFTLLDVGSGQSEFTIFEKGVAVNSRIIYFDGETLEPLAQTIKGASSGARLLVSGKNVSDDFITGLERALANGCNCERLKLPADEKSSAAICGLKKIAAQGSEPSLVIRLEQASNATNNFANLDWKKWGVRVGGLALALLLLPYVEALLLKPHLEKKVAAFKTESARLTTIDRELDFLRQLKQSQPPYLDVLFVFSKSVPPGTKFDALSLNSHGDVSLRCNFRDGQQVADFRTKLIESGFFTNVTVEEQVPTPDRQRVSVRISAQEKPLVQLQSLAVASRADDAAKDAKTNSTGATPLVSRKESK